MEEIEPPQKKLATLPRNREIQGGLMGCSRDAILGVNRKGTIVFWNKGAEQIFGYSSAEILGQPVTNLISQNNREDHARVLRAFLTGNCGETAHTEGQALRKDGSTFPLELSFSIEQQRGGFLALAIGRDITDRKNTERALRDSAERYCGLFATCLEAVFSTDVPDDTGEGNNSLEELSAYCLKELTEIKPANILSPENREYLSGQIDKILSTDEPVSSIVHEIFRKDGKRIFIEQYLDFINRRDKTGGSGGFHSDIAEDSIREEQSKDYLINLTKIVSRVIEFYDPYTAEHQQRVAELARLIGENMGLAEDVVERLYFNGLLHDIGKISIPKSILTKPGALADEEWALIRAHTKQGYNILKDASLSWPIADVALHHHERLDGSGYPDGIKEDKLSLEISILAVCDVVEAMSSHRPYRPARTTTEVLKELKDGRGAKYNAAVVDVMIPMIESGKFRSIWNSRDLEKTATRASIS
jgi:PAS domain S-box-containing protein